MLTLKGGLTTQINAEKSRIKGFNSIRKQYNKKSFFKLSIMLSVLMLYSSLMITISTDIITHSYSLKYTNWYNAYFRNNKKLEQNITQQLTFNVYINNNNNNYSTKNSNNNSNLTLRAPSNTDFKIINN